MQMLDETLAKQQVSWCTTLFFKQRQTTLGLGKFRLYNDKELFFCV